MPALCDRERTLMQRHVVAETGRRTRITKPGVDHGLQAGGRAEPTAALVEVHPREPEVELGPEELDRIGVRGGRELPEQLVDVAVDLRPLRVSAHHLGTLTTDLAARKSRTL